MPFPRVPATVLFFVLTFGIVATASAAPKIDVKIEQAKEKPQKGGGASDWVPTTSATPGDTIQYTLTYRNSGDAVARDAAVVDPIPKGTLYVSNSARGEGTEISFSSDGGKTYAPAVKLTYELKLPDGKTEKRVATPSQYTHIRWVVKEVPPGASGTVAFVVKVL